MCGKEYTFGEINRVPFLKTLNNATDILKEEKVIRISAVTVIKKYGKRTTDEVSAPFNP